MKRLLDRVLVIDVESTCWKDEPPPGQQSEIIEVGIASLVTSSRVVSKHPGLLVIPSVSEISPFCTELTTLTRDYVEDNGHIFHDVLWELRHEYLSPERVWASYGDYDRLMLERQCSRMGLEYPMSRTHLNVKTLFAVKEGLTREVGMAQALERLGLPLVGVHHRGCDDAANIARILKYCLWGEV